MATPARASSAVPGKPAVSSAATDTSAEVERPKDADASGEQAAKDDRLGAGQEE